MKKILKKIARYSSDGTKHIIAHLKPPRLNFLSFLQRKKLLLNKEQNILLPHTQEECSKEDSIQINDNYETETAYNIADKELSKIFDHHTKIMISKLDALCETELNHILKIVDDTIILLSEKINLKTYHNILLHKKEVRRLHDQKDMLLTKSYLIYSILFPHQRFCSVSDERFARRLAGYLTQSFLHLSQDDILVCLLKGDKVYNEHYKYTINMLDKLPKTTRNTNVYLELGKASLDFLSQLTSYIPVTEKYPKNTLIHILQYASHLIDPKAQEANRFLLKKILNKSRREFHEVLMEGGFPYFLDISIKLLETQPKVTDIHIEDIETEMNLFINALPSLKRVELKECHAIADSLEIAERLEKFYDASCGKERHIAKQLTLKQFHKTMLSHYNVLLKLVFAQEIADPELLLKAFPRYFGHFRYVMENDSKQKMDIYIDFRQNMGKMTDEKYALHERNGMEELVGNIADFFAVYKLETN